MLSLLPLLLLTFTPTLALPLATSPKYTTVSRHCTDDLTHPKDSLGVYMCYAPNFTGECAWEKYDPDKCHKWLDVNHRPRSVGPDGGGCCELFVDAECGGVARRIWGTDSHL